MLNLCYDAFISAILVASVCVRNWFTGVIYTSLACGFYGFVGTPLVGLKYWDIRFLVDIYPISISQGC